MKKTIISLVSSLVLFSTFFMNSTQTNASSLSPNQNSGVIDLNNLEELEKTGQVTIEEISYEEFIADKAEEKGITVEEAKVIHPNPNNSLNRTTNNDTPLAQASGYTMHKIFITQEVTAFYKPAVQIFVWMYSSGSFQVFEYIEEVNLDRDGVFNNYVSRAFTGIVKAKMTTLTSIWWHVNGDFYNNGTTTVTIGGGGEAGGVGTTVNANFSISVANNHYQYWENTGNAYLN